MPGWLWALALTLLPGLLALIAGNVVLFRGTAADTRRGARLVAVGFSLLCLLPGAALVVLVLLGAAQPGALIGAAGLIGFGALRLWSSREPTS